MSLTDNVQPYVAPFRPHLGARANTFHSCVHSVVHNIVVRNIGNLDMNSLTRLVGLSHAHRTYCMCAPPKGTADSFDGSEAVPLKQGWLMKQSVRDCDLGDGVFRSTDQKVSPKKN